MHIPLDEETRRPHLKLNRVCSFPIRSIPSQDCVDALLLNLKEIIEDNKDDEFVCPILLKLYDHISIDIARRSMNPRLTML